MNLCLEFHSFSPKNIMKTTVNKTIDNCIAVVTSFIENHALKIPVVKVLTPKYFTAPYSFNTSIKTRNKPESIAGLDNGKIIL